MKLSKIALALTAICISGGAMAHGFIAAPAERAALCYKVEADIGKNLNCGNVMWEAQSAGEGPDGFPLAGPDDGQIASGNNKSLSGNLDEQSATRWVKHPVKAGKQTFTWDYPAAHRTANTRYFMTKQDWNPNAPLTRESFDLQPFCVIDGQNQVVPSKDTHECELPERSGYQVILAIWDVADTGQSFHKVIDVMYEEGVSSEWSKTLGQITPSGDLPAGSTIQTRVFDARGERGELSTTLQIRKDEEGKKDVWTKALAEKINAEQTSLRAGNKNGEGDVVPVSGGNMIYSRADSGLTSVQVQVNSAEEKAKVLTVSDLKPSYEIKNGLVSIDYRVQANPGMTATTTWLSESVYDAEGKPVVNGNIRILPNGVEQKAVLPVQITKPGKYTLSIVATYNSERTEQQSFDINITEAGNGQKFDYVFPEGKGSYVAGTLVKQPADGKVYECKPWPYTAWCNSASDAHYAPGTGQAWQEAWLAK